MNSLSNIDQQGQQRWEEFITQHRKHRENALSLSQFQEQFWANYAQLINTSKSQRIVLVAPPPIPQVAKSTGSEVIPAIVQTYWNTSETIRYQAGQEGCFETGIKVIVMIGFVLFGLVSLLFGVIAFTLISFILFVLVLVSHRNRKKDAYLLQFHPDYVVFRQGSNRANPVLLKVPYQTISQIQINNQRLVVQCQSGQQWKDAFNLPHRNFVLPPEMPGFTKIHTFFQDIVHHNNTQQINP